VSLEFNFEHLLKRFRAAPERLAAYQFGTRKIDRRIAIVGGNATETHRVSYLATSVRRSKVPIRYEQSNLPGSRTHKVGMSVRTKVSGRPIGFWAWPIGGALCTSTAIGLDIAGIAFGYLPAVPGLLATFGFPAVVGFALGVWNRRAGWIDLGLMACVLAACLYFALGIVSLIGIALSSNISCAEPNAPWNCDNDTGSAAGLVIGAPLAAAYGLGAWLGSLFGAAIARWAIPGARTSS